MVSTMLHNMVVGMGNSARSLVLQEWIMDSSEEGRRMRDNPLSLTQWSMHSIFSDKLRAALTNKPQQMWKMGEFIWNRNVEMQSIEQFLRI